MTDERFEEIRGKICHTISTAQCALRRLDKHGKNGPSWITDEQLEEIDNYIDNSHQWALSAHTLINRERAPF